VDCVYWATSGITRLHNVALTGSRSLLTFRWSRSANPRRQFLASKGITDERVINVIRKFVKTARRYRTIQIQAGPHTITAADPAPTDLQAALDQIHGRSSAH
jgi:hypothetical protein